MTLIDGDDCRSGPTGSSLADRCRDCRLSILLLVLSIGWYLRGRRKYRRRLFHGGPRNDGVGRRPQFSFRESGRARADGMGGLGLSVRHSGHALVLDRRHSRDAVSRAGDDAVLLHFENPFGAGISQTAFRRAQPRYFGDFVCFHDRADERRQYVRHGESHADSCSAGTSTSASGFRR